MRHEPWRLAPQATASSLPGPCTYSSPAHASTAHRLPPLIHSLCLASYGGLVLLHGLHEARHALRVGHQLVLRCSWGQQRVSRACAQQHSSAGRAQGGVCRAPSAVQQGCRVHARACRPAAGAHLARRQGRHHLGQGALLLLLRLPPGLGFVQPAARARGPGAGRAVTSNAGGHVRSGARRVRCALRAGWRGAAHTGHRAYLRYTSWT